MATVKKSHLIKRVVNGNPIYYADLVFSDGLRKRISTGETSQLAALERMKEEIVRLEVGAKIESIPFGDFTERYLDMPTKKKTSPLEGRKNRMWYFKILVEHFGGEAVKESGAYHFKGGPSLLSFTPDVLEIYFAGRSKEVGVGCLNREIGSLKGLFKKAKKLKLVKENPMEEIEFHSEAGTERKRFLEVDEVNRLIDASVSPLREFLIILAHTGARPGEIRKAKWRDVRITDEHADIVVGRSKNGEGRILTLSGIAKKALLSIRGGNSDEYIFPATKRSKSGSPYDFTSLFHVAVEKAKLNRAGEEKLCFYHLRHFFISTLSRTGVDMFVGMELAGHKDTRSHRRYKHLYESQRRQAVNAVEKLIDQKNFGTKFGTVPKTAGLESEMASEDSLKVGEIQTA